MESLHLDGTFNVITNVAWDSDGWQEEDGSWWKSVKATGNRMIKRSRACFSGEVAEADLPMVRYTSRYVSDVTGYLITANVIYEEVQINSETVAEIETSTQPETIQEQKAANTAEDNTGTRVAGMPLAGSSIAVFGNRKCSIGFIMIGLLAKFRSKAKERGLTLKNVNRKGNKRKGEN